MNKIFELDEQILKKETANGNKIVKYHYCRSCFVICIPDVDICILNPNENRYVTGFKYAIKTLIQGPWSLPWGPIFTFTSIMTDLAGGKLVSDLVEDARNKTIAQKVVDYIRNKY